jgi:hypothetical protein
MADAGSYEGGALFETLTGVMGRALVERPDLVRDRVIATARRLAGRGADTLTMNCGFGVLFQHELATATGAIAVSSSLLLLPTLASLHAGRVGLITFDKAALNASHLAAAGWSADSPPALADVQLFPEWRLLDEERPVALPVEIMGQQLLETAMEFRKARDLRALVLECSAMVPFAPMLRRELQCSIYTIFDALNLARHGRNILTPGMERLS